MSGRAAMGCPAPDAGLRAEPRVGVAWAPPENTWPEGFRLPRELEAAEPPEARGLARDEVRLMVSYRAEDRVLHARFRDLPCFLEPGDLLVINTSGTMKAALPATRSDGRRLELHLSTRLPGDIWMVELRDIDGGGSQPFFDAETGETLDLPAAASVLLLGPYGRSAHPTQPVRNTETGQQVRPRLWLASLRLPLPVHEYLARHGFPIRYGYVKQEWPIDYYQTVYSTETGSAEMPSAGRPFTSELLTRLTANGVWIAPLVLHTGVASQEEGEPPYEEYYRVPLATARLVNAARAGHRRVVAVGTTVVRSLETVTDEEGTAHPGEGWTRLVIRPGYRLRVVDALLTGLHEPRSTHLDMLAALAGREHLRQAYTEALAERYLWHEFGDMHLIL